MTLHLRRRPGEGVRFETACAGLTLRVEKIERGRIHLILGDKRLLRRTREACVFKLGGEQVRLELKTQDNLVLEVNVIAPPTVNVLRQELERREEPERSGPSARGDA